MKKIAALLIALCTFILMQGCTEPCGRGNGNINYPKHFTYDSVQVQPQSVILQADSMINYSQSQVFQSGSVGLMVMLILNPIAKNEERKTPGFQFINAAYACSPVEPMMQPDEFFTNISIKTKYALDGNYPAGADVSHLFVTLEQAYNPNRIIRKSLDQWQISEVGAWSRDLLQIIYLDYPISSGPAAFEINIHLSSGRTLSAQTTDFLIQP